MNSSRMLPLVLAASALTLCSARAQLANPSFETGTLAGWDASTEANVSVVSTVTDYPFDPNTWTEDFSLPYTVSPLQGGYQARVAAGGLLLADLESFLGLTSGLLSNPVTDPFGIADGAAIAQTVTLDAGASYRLHWNFLAVDSLLDDFAFLSISGPDGSSVLTLASVFGVGGQNGTGWQEAVFTAGSAGDYRIGLGVANGEDKTVASILYVDGFSAVPEPSTYGLLAGLGCLAAAAWRRRR